MSSYLPYLKTIDYLGIEKGDTILVASDIRILGLEAMRHKEKFNLNDLIVAFIEKIGDEGTLLFPTYNWDFCSGIEFNYKETPSKTGSLSSAALRRDDFIRTKHPIYSFAVTGKDAYYLSNLNNKSAFGVDSPFAYLYEKKAKMVMLGVDYQQSFTYVHFVEEQEKVPYRYLKQFNADYKDHNGKIHQETYSMYVRDLEKGVITRVNPIGEVMERLGASDHKVMNKVDFHVIDLEKAYHIIQDDIRNNKARNLYTLAY